MRAMLSSVLLTLWHPPRGFLGSEGLDAREGLAFEPFQEGAAGRRHISERVRNAGVIERCYRIAAARHRDELAGPGALRGMAGRRHGALVERRDLEGAERAVPHQCRSVVDRGFDAFDRLGADI